MEENQLVAWNQNVRWGSQDYIIPRPARVTKVTAKKVRIEVREFGGDKLISKLVSESDLQSLTEEEHEKLTQKDLLNEPPHVRLLSDEQKENYWKCVHDCFIEMYGVPPDLAKDFVEEAKQEKPVEIEYTDGQTDSLYLKYTAPPGMFAGQIAGPKGYLPIVDATRMQQLDMEIHARYDESAKTLLDMMTSMFKDMGGW